MALSGPVGQADEPADLQTSPPLGVERRTLKDQPGWAGALIRTAVRSYRCGSSAERAGLSMLSSFAITVTSSRALNYVRERQRPAPRLRSWARHAYHLPGRERVRIHHFVPGVGLAFLSGAIAIIKREDRREFWFAVPFGAGVGLTFDEIAVITELDNPYWKSEKFALTQATVAAVGALALGSRLYLRAAAEQRTSSPFELREESGWRGD